MRRLAWPRAAPSWGTCVLLAILPAMVYLVRATLTYRWGFPLDDAWIHQTYARNLVMLGEWAYVPGETSGGSTAPLWTLLLAIGHALRVPPVVWASALGSLLLATLAWISARWVQRRGVTTAWVAWAVALGVLFEWHLDWAAFSGMETLAVALAAAAVLWAIDARAGREVLVGFGVGLAVWLRPDALSLALPLVVMVILDSWRRPGKMLRRLLLLTLGIGLAFVPYLLFNRATSGAWWPSTFYAKQAEYAVERQAGLLDRAIEQGLVPLTGIGILLAPGICLVVLQAWRTRSLQRLLPLLWCAAYLGAFALRLPVVYQHGRYAMPVIPIGLVLGWEGLAGWADLQSARLARRVVSRAWVAACFLVLLVFHGLGSAAFARDVAIIETEMVGTAEWIRENTPPGSRVAAHDIGALGYFGERPLLDLAGLVSPEVIPILRDEAALADFLQRGHADYLMTFPGWYPYLSRQGELVHVSEAPFSPAAGGENMAVYRWPSAPFAASTTAMLYSPHSGDGR
jgi:hypothetical protein